MSPQDKQKLNDLEKRLEAVESVRNVSFVKELERRMSAGLLTIETGATTSGTFVSVRNAADDGSEIVADNYAGTVSLYSNGSFIGRIGYYS